MHGDVFIDTCASTHRCRIRAFIHIATTECDRRLGGGAKASKQVDQSNDLNPISAIDSAIDLTKDLAIDSTIDFVEDLTKDLTIDSVQI